MVNTGNSKLFLLIDEYLLKKCKEADSRIFEMCFLSIKI